MQLIENLDIKDKRVLVRLDFDFLFDKNFQSGTKQKFHLVEPTINYLLEGKTKVIIAPSFTRGKKKEKAEYSIEPYARHICEIYKCNVYMTQQSVGDVPVKLSQDMEPGSILFLENLFESEDELKGETEFGEKLSKIADIYVNEAFSLSDRGLSSNTAVLDFMDDECFCPGFNFYNEYMNIQKIRSEDAGITLCINDDDLSGSLALAESLIDKVGLILLFGEVSNLYSVIKNDTRNRNYPENLLNKMKKFNNAAEVRDIKILSMVDYYTRDGNEEVALIRNEMFNDRKGYLDIGEETGKNFSDAISDSGLLIWLGNLPYNKESDLVFGSAKIIENISNKELYTIGLRAGSENRYKNQNEDGFFNFHSSCNNIFTKSIKNEQLPGLEKFEAKFG